MKILLDAGQSPRGWHRLEAFMRCPTLYAIQRPGTVMEAARAGTFPEDVAAQWREARDRAAASAAGSAPLARGSLYHIGLAHHYARIGAAQSGGLTIEGVHHTDPNAFYAPVEAATVAAHRAENPVWLEQLPVVVEGLEAYADHWDGRESLRPLAVEEVWWLRFKPDPSDPQGELPLGQGRYDLSYRVDLVAEDARGRVYFIDHKTTGYYKSGGLSHARYYARTGQFVGYKWLGTLHYGERFAGTILNLVQLRPGAVRFARPPLEPVPSRIKHFPHHCCEAEDRLAMWIERTLKEGLSPLDWPGYPSEFSCETRYGPCPAVDLCDWGF